MRLFPYLSKKLNPKKAAQKRARGICTHWGCTRPLRELKQTDCWTCKSRKHRLAHPEDYAYRMVKESARKRGITFLLTREEFIAWAKQNNYLDLKGVRAKSYHIDRIDPDGPYSLDNIRLLTASENCSRVRRPGEEDTYTPPEGQPF